MSSGRAKYDPLEAAKLAADGGPAAPKAEEKAPTSTQAAAPSEVKTTPSSAPTAPMAPAKAAAPTPPPAPKAAAPAAPTPPPAPAPVPKKTKYKVMKDKRVSVGGQLCDWKAGRVIDPAGFGGEVGIKRLRDQGLVLEKIEE